MADSETSTSPSNVTRRCLLAGAMTAALAPPSIEKGGSFTAPPMTRQSKPYDLALTLWREWRAAHRVTDMLCRKQQRLETRLVKTIGFPRAIVEVGGNLGATAIFSVDELDRLIGVGHETASRSCLPKSWAWLVLRQFFFALAGGDVGVRPYQRSGKGKQTLEPSSAGRRKAAEKVHAIGTFSTASPSYDASGCGFRGNPRSGALGRMMMNIEPCHRRKVYTDAMKDMQQLKDRQQLTVGRLAKLAGLSPKSIRYYEQKKLIPKAGRSMTGYRLYSPQILERLKFIQKAKAVGFSLDDVQRILDLADRGKPCCDRVYEWSERRLRELDEQICFLSNVRARLAHYQREWASKSAAAATEAKICKLIEKIELRDGRP